MRNIEIVIKEWRMGTGKVQNERRKQRAETWMTIISVIIPTKWNDQWRIGRAIERLTRMGPVGFHVISDVHTDALRHVSSVHT